MAEDTMNVIAHSIAKEQFDRISTLAEKITKGTTTGEIPFSNYTCPICGVMDLQPLRRKWLFFEYGKPIAGYACQTKHCPAKGVVIPPKLVQAALDTMTDEVSAEGEGKRGGEVDK